MQHLFIVNPAAGGKKHHYTDTIRLIRTAAGKQADPYEIYVTKAPMDATNKIRQAAAAAQEPLRVYACGGDGTLNECVNGAAGLDNVSLAHYPCGTGNDFIKVFGKDAEKWFRDIPALMNGTARPMDLIETTTPDGVRYGINICSVGIDARIGGDVHKYSAIPVIGGATGYVVSTVVNLIRGINQKLTIQTPDQTLSGSFALLCACNGQYYGGGFNPVPEAVPDDGILEYLVAKAVSRATFLRMIGKYAKGKFREIKDIITHIRGTTMTIDSDVPLAVNIDGEIVHARRVTFGIAPVRIGFILPENTDFHGSNQATSGASD
jgi:YegS/Rv2252/BmrU family lipid kinase